MRSLFEWVVAIALLVGAVRFAAPWVARWGPKPSPPSAGEPSVPNLPLGVAEGAVSVPLLVLIDGTELHVGLTETALRGRLSDRLAASSPVSTRGVFGERITLAYLAKGTRFWVVIERPQPGDQMQVAAIWMQPSRSEKGRR